MPPTLFKVRFFASPLYYDLVFQLKNQFLIYFAQVTIQKKLRMALEHFLVAAQSKVPSLIFSVFITDPTITETDLTDVKHVYNSKNRH